MPFTLIDKSTGEETFCGVPATRRHPCPVCGHPRKGATGWCLVDRARGLTICPYTESKRKIGEAGWLHGQDVERKAATWVTRAPCRPRTPINFSSLNEACRARGASLAVATQLQDELGVSAQSLLRLGIGWHDSTSSYSFPMFNASGRVIGLRLRKEDGGKFAATGSQNGLFLPSQLSGNGPLFIEEGPTSTAAVLDMGLDCIGRPSCSACVDMLTDFVASVGAGRTAVIIANNDAPQRRPDGTVFRPGIKGGEALARQLIRATDVKIIMPNKGKDSRDWKRAGATGGLLFAIADNTPSWRDS